MAKGVSGEAPRKRGRPKSSETRPLSGSATALGGEEQRQKFVQGIGELERAITKNDETIAAAKAMRKNAAAKVRELREGLKAQGFDPAEIDFALFLRKTDESEAVDRHRRQMRVANWLAHPIGTQSDMFDGAPGTHPSDGPFEQGKVSGLAGESLPSGASLLGGRWQPNSSEGQRFMAGHAEGQSELIKGIKPVHESAGPGRGMPGARPPEQSASAPLN